MLESILKLNFTSQLTYTYIVIIMSSTQHISNNQILFKFKELNANIGMMRRAMAPTSTSFLHIV